MGILKALYFEYRSLGVIGRKRGQSLEVLADMGVDVLVTRVNTLGDHMVAIELARCLPHLEERNPVW
jgi:hypothetical protein